VTWGAHVRVGVNGDGAIGKRVADAVRAQPDMVLVGVSDVTTDYRIQTAQVLGPLVYASDRAAAMAAGPHGSVHEPFIGGGPARARPFFRRLLADRWLGNATVAGLSCWAPRVRSWSRWRRRAAGDSARAPVRAKREGDRDECERRLSDLRQ